MCKTSSDIPLAGAEDCKSGDASLIDYEPTVDSKVEVALDTRKGTVVAGYSVLTKSMLGSGLFFIAHTCSKFGILAGLAAIAFAGLITWISLRALSIIAIEFKDEQPTFYSVSQRIVPKLSWVVDASVIMNCLGAATGYVITAGNLLADGLLQMFYGDAPLAEGTKNRSILIIQASMIVALGGLAMMKELSGTKYANLVGLVALLYIVITSFFYCDLSQASSALLKMPDFLSAMGAFPTFIFAFACQMNVFQIANELKNPTVKRMNIISISSTLTGAAIYIPVMIIPLLSFGRDIKENYLQSLDISKVPVQVAYLFAALSVSISYVLQIHPLRRSILSLYYGARTPSDTEEKRNRILVVAVAMLATFGIAVGVKKIDIVTNFTGLIGGNTMCFTMPTWWYLKKYGYKKDLFGKLVLSLFVVSLLLFPICLTGIIYDMAKTN
jgi:amino acid permease